jgi:hypothetical protein
VLLKTVCFIRFCDVLGFLSCGGLGRAGGGEFVLPCVASQAGTSRKVETSVFFSTSCWQKVCGASGYHVVLLHLAPYLPVTISSNNEGDSTSAGRPVRQSDRSQGKFRSSLNVIDTSREGKRNFCWRRRPFSITL